MLRIALSNSVFFALTEPANEDPSTKVQKLELLPARGIPQKQSETTSPSLDTQNSSPDQNTPSTTNTPSEASTPKQEDKYIQLNPVSPPPVLPKNHTDPIPAKKTSVDYLKVSKAMYILAGIFGAIGVGAVIPLLKTAFSDSQNKTYGLAFSGIALGGGLVLGVSFAGLGKHFSNKAKIQDQ